jgi:hypothetical protein
LSSSSLGPGHLHLRLEGQRVQLHEEPLALRRVAGYREAPVLDVPVSQADPLDLQILLHGLQSGLGGQQLHPGIFQPFLRDPVHLEQQLLVPEVLAEVVDLPLLLLQLDARLGQGDEPGLDASLSVLVAFLRQPDVCLGAGNRGFCLGPTDLELDVRKLCQELSLPDGIPFLHVPFGELAFHRGRHVGLANERYASERSDQGHHLRKLNADHLNGRRSRLHGPSLFLCRAGGE